MYYIDDALFFIAKVPELPRYMADGSAQNQVLENVQNVLARRMETAQSQGREAPKAKGRGTYA